MSCPLHNNDWSCAGCAKLKTKRLEETLYAIMQISINDMDHDMMRVFKLCDKALEDSK